MGFAVPEILAAAFPEAAGAATGITWAGSGMTAATLADIGSAISFAGTGLSAVGAIQQGNARSSAAKYNAQVAANNAAIAQRNAEMAGQAGEEQVAMQQQKTRATTAAIKANQAAAGVDINSGSALDVRSSAAQLGQLDAITLRSNATRQAYGYQIDSVSQQAQSQLDNFEAENDSSAGYVNAGATLLGGIGSASNNYIKYKAAGGLNYAG